MPVYLRIETTVTGSHILVILDFEVGPFFLYISIALFEENLNNILEPIHRSVVQGGAQIIVLAVEVSTMRE